MVLYAVFRQALKEYLRINRIVPLLLLAMVSALLAVFWKSVSSSSHLSDQYTGILVFYGFRIGALVGALVATNILNAEIDQKTIVYLLTRPIPRWQLLIGRYLACSVVVSAVNIVAILSAAMGVYGLGGLKHGVVFTDMAAVALGCLAYCGVFTLISVFSNRSLIINLLIAFGWEVMVPSLPGTAYLYSILTYMMGMHLGRSSSSVDLSLLSNLVTSHDISLIQCVVVLGGIAVVTAGIAAAVFSVSEFIPKEQAA